MSFQADGGLGCSRIMLDSDSDSTPRQHSLIPRSPTRQTFRVHSFQFDRMRKLYKFEKSQNGAGKRLINASITRCGIELDPRRRITSECDKNIIAIGRRRAGR